MLLPLIKKISSYYICCVKNSQNIIKLNWLSYIYKTVDILKIENSILMLLKFSLRYMCMSAEIENQKPTFFCHIEQKMN